MTTSLRFTADYAYLELNDEADYPQLNDEADYPLSQRLWNEKLKKQEK
jgi:hypothetical protein